MIIQSLPYPNGRPVDYTVDTTPRYRILVTSVGSGTVVQVGDIEFYRDLDQPVIEVNRLIPTSTFASSTNGANAASRCFDTDLGLYWENSGDLGGGNCHVGGVFTTGSEPIAVALSSAPGGANAAPTAFAVQKSTDGGTSYTTLWSETVTGWMAAERRMFVNPAYTVPNGAQLAFGWKGGQSFNNVNAVNNTSHRAIAWRQSAGADMYITKLDVVLLSGGGGSTVQFAIYGDSSGVPGALLGVTETKAISSGTSDTFNISGSFPLLLKNQDYWIACRSSGTLTTSAGTAASGFSKIAIKTLAGTSSFTDPFGTSTASSQLLPIRLSGTNGFGFAPGYPVLTGDNTASVSMLLTGTAVSTSYQWTRNGVDIAGATSSTYTAGSSDDGKLLACRVTVTDALGRTATRTTPGVPYSSNWRILQTASFNGYLSAADIEIAASAGGADQCNGGTASSSSLLGAGVEADKAFDASTTTYFHSAFESSGWWIKYVVASSACFPARSLRIRNRSDDTYQVGLKDGKLQYWDGSAYVDKKAITNTTWGLGEQRTYDVS